jgi:hypothetical protein
MSRGIAALIVSSFVATLGMVPLGHAAIPDLECHADEQTRIDSITLDADHSDVSDIYRIKGGNLFITTSGRAEYLYNEIVEVEPGRFVSGHKTLLLTARTADAGRRMLVLHFHELDIRVTRFFCR